MRSLPVLSALLVLLLGACSAPADDTADDTSGNGGGRPVDDNDDNGDEDAGGSDEEDSTRPGTDTGGGGTDGGTTPGRDVGVSTDSGGGGGDDGCNATNLDAAVACQVSANEGFVEAYCDCFTDVGYAGDRAACEADQPGADAFALDGCTRAALLRDEAASIANSACYAAAVNDLEACFLVCPPDEETFDACFSTLEAAFDVCDRDLPATVTDALTACGEGGGGGTTDPPADVASALDALRAERDSYVTTRCGCEVGSAFPSLEACRTALTTEWDPGLSACEETAFAEDSAASLPFITCITQSFTIAESACMECPEPGSIEADLCTDLSVDLNFCFADADSALQDALIACSE
jgi:hypothetical protein